MGMGTGMELDNGPGWLNWCDKKATLGSCTVEPSQLRVQTKLTVTFAAGASSSCLVHTQVQPASSPNFEMDSTVL